MDKFTIGKIATGIIAFCCVLGMVATVRNWQKGELKRSRTGGLKFQTFTRENNPETFDLYCLDIFIMNAFLFIVFTAVTILVHPQAPKIE